MRSPPGAIPQHAAVAVTTGLLRMLSREELAGVIAHELAHIKNHDTLTMTITATIAGAISMLAQFGMFFGGGHRDNNSGLGVIGTLAMVILAPIAAMLVQMAISRTREYAADDLGARISGRPDALASALVKISKRRAADRERHGRAQPRDRASFHHQSAESTTGWTTCSRPIPRPRTASPRSSDWPPRWDAATSSAGRARPAIARGRGARGVTRVAAAAHGV